MKKSLYEDIVTTISNFQGQSRDCLALVKTKYQGLNHDTLASITSNEYVKWIKQNYARLMSRQNKFYNLYMDAILRREEPGIILRLAEKYRIPPCFLAKLLLLQHFSDVENDKMRMDEVKKCLRDTTLIKNMDLAYEVYLATIFDDVQSPLENALNNSIGQQYEIQLYRQITELGLVYKDEQDLRKFGYDKTPDVKLDIPIAIDGFVVHWIESKAIFVDERIHAEYLASQYSSYWNRFGPGLVIYWFGFVETVYDKSDKRFIIKDHFPSNIVQLTRPEDKSI